MIRYLLTFIAAIALTACAAPQVQVPQPQRDPAPRPVVVDRGAPLTPQQARRNFLTVVETVEPIAEAVCRERAPRLNCDFQIAIDPTENAPPNAFQTVDRRGRPVIAFTLPLIAAVRNQDELAFIMAHEAAHHIEMHLLQLQRNAAIGAQVFGLIVGSTDPQTVRAAQEIGAAIGGRAYSKEFELEADALGTIITAAAGYDPLIGAEFFQRIPDPGNVFLGTHPPNAQRIDTVRRVAAGLR